MALRICDVCGAGFTPVSTSPRCSTFCRRFARREKQRVSERKYWQGNKGLRAKAGAAYYQANRDAIREKRRKWREANLERSRAANRRWKSMNPDSTSAARRQRRALVMNAPTGLPYTRESVVAEHGATCYLCTGLIDLAVAVPEPFSLALDHVLPLRLGGVDGAENILPTHFICNSRKGGALLLSTPCFEPIGLTVAV